MDHAFDVSSKKVLPYTKLARFSPMLSSGNFIVLCFTFRSMIHFEFIFVKDIRSESRFIHLHVDVQLFRHRLLKRLPLLHYMTFAPLSKISRLFLCGSISGFSIPLMCLFILSVPHCLDYCSFIVSLKVRQHQSSNLVLLLQYCTGYSVTHIFWTMNLLWHQCIR